MLGCLRRPFAFVLLAAIFVPACSDESEPGPVCSDANLPAFRVRITCEDGALPDDVRIEVTYGAGNEVYELDDDTRANKAVFCKPEPADAAAPEAVVCDLWTSGAATLKVTAEGYETIDEMLSAERDECGIKLTEIERKLEKEKADAGE